MKIDYAFSARALTEKIVCDAQAYCVRSESWWNDRVENAVTKNADEIKEKALGIREAFGDISALTDKFADCRIDDLTDSASADFYNFTALEGEISGLAVKSTARDEE